MFTLKMLLVFLSPRTDLSITKWLDCLFFAGTYLSALAEPLTMAFALHTLQNNIHYEVPL